MIVSGAKISWFLNRNVVINKVVGHADVNNILRKTIEGYLDSVPSLTFNTIKNKIIMHAFHSSIYLQSKWMLHFSHATMVLVQYKS